MNKQISELFDYGDEIAVALREPPEGCDPAEIKELTMKRIHEEGTTPIEYKQIVKKARPAWRTALIAAAIALMLSVAALAAYQLGLKDLVLRERDDGITDISVVGWRDTPEYQAFVEWGDYLHDYDETHGEAPDVKFDGSFPVEYLRLGAYNEEMMAALDGMLDKYGLTMHDGTTVPLPAEGSGVDLETILLGDVQGAGGYAYSDGTMMLEVMQALSGGETVEYQLFSAVKGTFTMISGGVDEGYEEWTYAAADGTEVNLVMGEHSSMIVADLDNTFVTVNTVFHHLSDKAALEELADSLSWEALDACPHVTSEYYEDYKVEREARDEEGRLTGEAEMELNTWMLSDEILADYGAEPYGRTAADSEDGTAFVEWTYTRWESEDTIRVRYERPAGDIQDAFEIRLADSGLTDAAAVLEDVLIYVRTDTETGAEYTTEHEDFPVYFAESSEGGWSALWLDEAKDLIFSLEADPGTLTGEELEEEISGLLRGLEPHPMIVEPEIIWEKLGRWEPEWLPEGWHSEPETQTASAMTLDGVWSGRADQAYIDGQIGHILWFTYESAPEGATPRSLLELEIHTTEEELAYYGVTLTDTTVNGHPALLREAYRSADLLWIDEEAGVLFDLNGDDAETVIAMAESVTAR